jgi:hypothetical protein
MSMRSLQFGSLSNVAFSTNVPQSCVVTVKANQPVLTVEQAKVWLRQDRVNYDNIDIDVMIEAVTEQLERASKLDFVKRERLAEWVVPRNRLYLPYGKHGDILEVKGFDRDGTEYPLTEYVVYGLDFKWIELNEAVHRVQVRFESGWNFDDVPTAFRGAVRHELTLTMNYRSGSPAARTVQNGMSIEARQLLLPFMKKL